MSEKKSKIAFLFNTRNNYNLFEDIFFKYTSTRTHGHTTLKYPLYNYNEIMDQAKSFRGSGPGRLPPESLPEYELAADIDLSRHYIFNYDLDSRLPAQLKKKEEVLKKYNIIDIPTSFDGDNEEMFCASFSMQACIEYIRANNLDIEWVFWFSHDCHLIGDDFMERLEKMLEDDRRLNDEVGMIGFCDYNTLFPEYPVYGRGILVDGIREPRDTHLPGSAGNHIIYGNYTNLPKEYEEAEYFIVEAPQDNGAMINVKLWEKHIFPDEKFLLYNWMDDIAAQFGCAGIPSVTIPSLEMADLFREKPRYGIPRSIGNESQYHRANYHTAASHADWWYEKFGYHRLPRPMSPSESKRLLENDFYVAGEELEGSVQKKILSWHINDGPKTLDDLE